MSTAPATPESAAFPEFPEIVDITEQKRELEARKLLASIVESSDDAIISKDFDGTILSWNGAAERIFGYTPAEAIGKSITLVVPLDRLDEEKTILQRLRQGDRIDHFETERISKRGERLNVSVTISPVRDSEGCVVGASKVLRDITSRKRAEAAEAALKEQLAIQFADLRRLHEMSVRLATTLELQPILDETLRTAAVFQRTDLGLISLCDGAEEGRRIGASLGVDDELLEEFQQVPPGGTAGSSLEEHARILIEDVETDARYADFRESARRLGFRAVHSVPLITRHGKIVGVLATYFRQPYRPTDREQNLIDLCCRLAANVIENARLYRQLRQMDRRKDEFLAMLAHELRNPLAPITNALQILQLTDDLPPPVNRIREIMQRQVTYLVRLVDDLLEVSRIAGGKIELRKERVDLISVIHAALETSRPAIDAGRHHLGISIPHDPIRIEVDPVRLAQVLSNLLTNAAKYTEPAGEILLSVRTVGDAAVISVRDTGSGIAPEMLPRIFEMFSQADRTLSRSQGGLGIGLALAQSLVELHGGSLEAKSDGLGKGSEFLVRLPLAREMATAVPPSAADSGTPNEMPHLKVLVVDDVVPVAFMLAQLLEMLGQEVHTAHNAPTALDDARLFRPDVIFSDIAMPGMDGYELARRVRRDALLRETPLVAMTGYGQESDRKRTFEAGFDHHLVKPASIEVLQELLSQIAARAAH